jgi:hypothetical protein
LAGAFACCGPARCDAGVVTVDALAAGRGVVVVVLVVGVLVVG